MLRHATHTGAAQHERLHAARDNMIPEARHPRLRAACSSPRCHWAVGKGTRKHRRRYRRTPRHAGARLNLRGRGHAHSRAPQPAHRNIRSRSAVTSDATVTTDRLANIMPSHVDGVHVLHVQTYKAFACVQTYKLLKKKRTCMMYHVPLCVRVAIREDAPRVAVTSCCAVGRARFLVRNCWTATQNT